MSGLFARLIRPVFILFLNSLASLSIAEDAPSSADFEVIFHNLPDPPFVIRLFDQDLIAHARHIVSGEEKEEVSVMGKVVKEPAPYNPSYSFHLSPASVSFFSFAVEVCDAAPKYVDERLDDVGGAFLPGNIWCPWTSLVWRELKSTGRLGGRAEANRVPALQFPVR